MHVHMCTHTINFFHPFLIKTLIKLDIKGNFLNWTNSMYKVIVILTGEHFSLLSKDREQGLVKGVT